MLTSQALVLATAMAASAGTIIIFNLFQERYYPIPRIHHVHEKQALKPCLSPGGKRRRGDGRRRKRVRFAEDVKKQLDSTRDWNGKFGKKVGEIERNIPCGRNNMMPANRVALYSGILKNRFQRMEYSY
ncbi:uncharacterized protein [Henckelia pumila]|uniref:uncharacterized protein n=1 Tax=Henckelia pumila TaxID=405737 RepID=UPI003C6E7F8B